MFMYIFLIYIRYTTFIFEVKKLNYSNKSP